MKSSKFVAILLGLLTVTSSALAETKLLNVSFDIARELYNQINPAFVAEWKKQTGETITVNQSHGGSSKQARSVLEGLAADVVTFNQTTDIDVLAEKNLVAKDWRTKFPQNSSPYTSTIIFLVRKGNPKGIKDWNDLVKPGVSVVVPNPKTSGNGRYSYLSAYGYALKKQNKTEAQAREFVTDLFKNVPVLDTGGRGATTTFVQREIGDALLTFESEVFLTVKELGADKFDIVVPSYSIEAEMPVAVVQKVVSRKGTEKAAKAYLEFLYTDAAQEIIAQNFYRPRSEKVAKNYEKQFGKLELFSIDQVFGGWAAAQKTHFADGGIFDQIYQAKR